MLGFIILYLSKLLNVFVKIVKCICQNCWMYLSKIPNIFVKIGQSFNLQGLSWWRCRDKSNVGIYWKTFPRSQVLLTRAIRANLENFFRRGCYWTQIWSDKRNTNFFPIFTSFLCQQKGSKEFTVQANCNISDTMASAFKISSHSYSCQRSGKMQIWAN